ncbi:MAG TPA: PPOX class F420-dependent oxidoreductase [Ktedonobacterales bacterium]
MALDTQLAIDDKVRAFLEEKRFAVLATINEDGLPHQTVMWYELRGDHIMMNTKVSRVKHNNLSRDSRISICVEDGYRFVTISGVAQLNDDQAVGQADIHALAVRYHGEEEGARQAEQFAKQQRVTILLPLSHVIVSGF